MSWHCRTCGAEHAASTDTPTDCALCVERAAHEVTRRERDDAREAQEIAEGGAVAVMVAVAKLRKERDEARSICETWAPIVEAHSGWPKSEPFAWYKPKSQTIDDLLPIDPADELCRTCPDCGLHQDECDRAADHDKLCTFRVFSRVSESNLTKYAWQTAYDLGRLICPDHFVDTQRMIELDKTLPRPHGPAVRDNAAYGAAIRQSYQTGYAVFGCKIERRPIQEVERDRWPNRSQKWLYRVIREE